MNLNLQIEMNKNPIINLHKKQKQLYYKQKLIVVNPHKEKETKKLSFLILLIIVGYLMFQPSMKKYIEKIKINLFNLLLNNNKENC